MDIYDDELMLKSLPQHHGEIKESRLGQSPREHIRHMRGHKGGTRKKSRKRKRRTRKN